jgi:hypothetical protein
MENILDLTRRVLTTTPARWQSLTSALPEDLLRRQPKSGEWSALDCLQHLIDTERGVFPVRIRIFLAGKDSFPAFNPDAEGTPPGQRSPLEMAAEFTQLRQAGLEALERVTPADLSRQARHGELGLVTLEQMIHEWAAHDLMHTVQAERALMQPFILGSGAWLKYFIDHIAL